MRFVLVVLLLLVWIVPSMAQEDTLVFAKIRSYDCFEGISKISVTDIHQNGSYEVVAQGLNHIYLYDTIDSAFSWTSSYSWYNDIQFFDMNHDGDLDIAYRDTSGFYIYDIEDALIIWSDPHLKDYLICLGDRNSDGLADIIAMRRQPLETSYLPDTVFVEIYDGPSYQLAGQFYFEVEGYHPYCDIGNTIESPSKAIIVELSAADSLQRRIVIFTSIETDCYRAYMPGYECHTQATGGNIKIIDPINFNVVGIFGSGSLSPLNDAIQMSEGDSAYLYAITQDYDESVDLGMCSDYWETDKYLRIISANGLQNSTRFYRYHTDQAWVTDWKGFHIGDISTVNPGKEICFGANDTLRLLSYPGLIPTWSEPVTFESGGFTGYMPGIYHSNSLFQAPQIFIRYYFQPPYLRLYDGSTGLLSGIVLGRIPSLRQIMDLDSDGEDEILADSSHYLNIYRLERAPVSVDDEADGLPLVYRLSPNYPNPFNPATIIQYDLPKSAFVTLDIFDLLGRKIQTLVNAEQEAGRHSVVWDGQNNSTGIYLYRIKSGDYSQTKKMLLIK